MHRVLIPSPFVGPGTWEPVASRLREAGRVVVVADLRSVLVADDPVARAVELLAPVVGGGSDPSILVPHSGAGPLIPAVVDGLPPGTVAGVVFVDAGLPEPGSRTRPLASPDFLDMLRPLLDERGMLPRWSDWWDPADVVATIPDPVQRAALTEEMPEVPFAYLERSIAIPEHWPAVPGAYLLFDPDSYRSDADLAASLGWPVETLTSAAHLEMVRDPDRVVGSLLRLVERLP